MSEIKREDDLDTLLAGLRDADSTPSPALQARVMADAVREQPRIVGRAKQPARQPLLGRLAAVFGGGGVLAGLSMATVAGLVIGVMQPGPVAALSQALLIDAPIDYVELLPDAGLFWGED